jgi:hypothetical protein
MPQSYDMSMTPSCTRLDTFWQSGKSARKLGKSARKSGKARENNEAKKNNAKKMCPRQQHVKKTETSGAGFFSAAGFVSDHFLFLFSFACSTNQSNHDGNVRSTHKHRASQRIPIVRSESWHEGEAAVRTERVRHVMEHTQPGAVSRREIP